jgi:L-ascorbate metabolism protein UlaG (beta-lactamase superfamily)
MRRLIPVLLFLAAMLTGFAAAVAAPVTSKCLAVAQDLPPVVPVAYRNAALENNQVRITYIGHSTFVIESPKGIRAATDYAGWHGTGPIPDVVTMNHAHETHYTDHPDPAIKHVLRGWNPDGGWAEHNLTVGDMYVRNVPTNIRTWDGIGTEKFGNSVFIFEVGGLCIGHLGHLHHELTAQQLGQIGQLDVVMAAVDGTWTLDHEGMRNVLKELRARIVIPMHFFGSLDAFLTVLGDDFTVRRSESDSVIVSPATMPLKPEVLVLPGY